MATTKKILLVEDDEFTQFMMKEVIGTLEVQVDVAGNGQEGCECLDEQPDAYCLVLMDIHMPILSGVDATRQIRSSPNDPPRNVPIIALTADEKYHDQAVVSKHGMDGFVAKPVSPGQILGLINKYCHAA